MGNHISVVTVPGDKTGEGRDKYYLSILPTEVVFKHGLIPEAIVGEYLERPDELPLDPEKFVANTVFKGFLQKFLETFSVDPAVAAEAKRIHNGTVTVVDQRVPDLNAAIKLEDILGGFVVEGGSVIGYRSNPNHRLLNQFGFFELPPAMMASLVDRIQRLCKNEG